MTSLGDGRGARPQRNVGGEAGLREFAPAKINLTLRVVGRRQDGRHLLDSLTVFADLGDWIDWRPGPTRPTHFHGPYGETLRAVCAGGASSVDTARQGLLQAVREAGEGQNAGQLTIEKRLPLASGMGGGSADAAAAMRLLRRALALDLSQETLSQLALQVGADVPSCVLSQPLRMRGIGEAVTPLAAWPAFDAVLINPNAPCPTADVFAAYREDHPDVPTQTLEGDLTPPSTDDCETVLRWLAAQTNDLTTQAKRVQPAVTDALEEASALPGAQLARMTGSGATVFALFQTQAAARAAADALSARRANWWIRACRFQGAAGKVQDALVKPVDESR